ncbi:hypothetical protein NCC49_005243 [Naganishia albida]|nr:hypothetical protein NCC49_005243 [Naganishia albida]
MQKKLQEIREQHDGRPGWIGRNELLIKRSSKPKGGPGRPRVRRGSDASVDARSNGEDGLVPMSEEQDPPTEDDEELPIEDADDVDLRMEDEEDLPMEDEQEVNDLN